MKRSAVWCSLVLITSFIFTYSSPSVAMANSLEKKVDNIEKEESENVNKKEKVEKEKENLIAKQNETENKIEELDMAILENNQKMTKIEEQVTSTQEKINELKKEIEQIKRLSYTEISPFSLLTCPVIVPIVGAPMLIWPPSSSTPLGFLPSLGRH